MSLMDMTRDVRDSVRQTLIGVAGPLESGVPDPASFRYMNALFRLIRTYRASGFEGWKNSSRSLDGPLSHVDDLAAAFFAASEGCDPSVFAAVERSLRTVGGVASGEQATGDDMSVARGFVSRLQKEIAA